MFKIACIFVLLSSTVFAKDPNLMSYKGAGECSEYSKEEKCVYCPAKRKFVSLPQSSKDQTPKDGDYELVEAGTPEEGTK
ncbi:MAG: hypothetical protein OM95_07970 [Bdellovibrio sp. ArHS]|uniref:hypothetical protein n=1 Tax=Bdellovibrio sp. ArHS TaxID=1569284 RepID=UPI00058307B7|nr:hypothetical protein [Bdellovibrio sp. ArHS]KHD88722.1 MAG: hypothetical protein OM95_07970 [Bdellovibrio sp. ArHS]